MKSIKLKFWGVRGSIPTPGSSTVQYGGNTPCVQVNFNQGPLFILDAGSGIREFGNELLQSKKYIKAYIFISHFHWDHIQGLPFFRPAFDPNNNFTILGTDDPAIKLDKIISLQMDPTYFPITIEDMKAKINFRSIKEESFDIEKVNIQTIYLNHPGYALGFRITFKGKSIVYISDNEPFQYDFIENNSSTNKIKKTDDIEKAFNNFIEEKDQNLVEFCRDTDLLIHDTQYFPEEYKEKVTWGHSPFNYTVYLAIKSHVKKLVLFHHDPDHDDNTIDHIVKLCKKLISKEKQQIPCIAAKEGMVLEL
jgi:phosphoribosyl 1,2-cyclic phosphodiesterase